jgi:hypothetical protein
VGNATPTSSGCNRRQWLRAGLAAGLLAVEPWRARGASDCEQGEEEVLERAAEVAREAGLGAFRTVRTEIYLGTGNAAERFCSRALALCEGLCGDYLRHFGGKGFSVTRPRERLVVVVLSDHEALAAFLGEAPDPAVRGVYDLEENWLVICDNRGEGGPLAERANSVALFHEATHQLTYHTGLLDREADLPLAISEGLGTYGETRRPDGRTKIGARNAERLAVLEAEARSGWEWIPLERLITEDSVLEAPKTWQRAYSQSWLLVHMMMRTRAEAGRLRAYLEAVKPRRDAARRLFDVEEHLGPVAAMDEALRGYANRLFAR